MPRLTYTNERSVEIPEGTSIVEASRTHGIPHTTVCGGNARCSTCRVAIIDGLERCSPRNEKEQAIATLRNFPPNIRLACQTLVHGDVALRRLVLDAEDVALVRDELNQPGEHTEVGRESNVAILFSDIRNFTSFSEQQLPYDVIHLLNRYFSRINEDVTRHGGVIDNFMGDGIMAVFGVPGIDSAPNPSLRAVRAGLDMLRSVAALHSYFLENCGWNLRIGVGIHRGPVIVGVVGAGVRRKTTVIGDAVNFASRIESANKEAGSELLISAATYEDVKHQVEIGRLHELTVKGKAGTHRLYEVLAERS